MKSLTAAIAAICLLYAAASASDLDEAKARFDAADYTAAATLYGKALQRAPRDPALHYDLGNALFRAGKLGPAIASYQRAFEILPRDGDIRYNLGFALRRAGEELVPPGVPPVMFALFYWLSERELAGLHWLACWAALLLAAAFLLGRAPARPAIIAAAAWAVFGLWWGLRLKLEPAQRGVIVAASAEIRSGPADTFPVSFTAPEGRRVEVLGEQGSWLEIGVLKEGERGWIKKDAVERL